MLWMDKLVAWNARQSTSRPVLAILLKGVVGYCLGGVLLAVIVPALHRQGVSPRDWMAWAVILISIAACVAPDLYYRRRLRRGALPG